MYTIKSNDGYICTLDIESDVLKTLESFPSDNNSQSDPEPILLRNFSMHSMTQV